jgi:hypothetical protein
MANDQNLKPWKSGQSGNPAGKPKGTKHLSTWIQELMEDENFVRKLANGKTKKEAPVKAIVATLIQKAVDGDMKAFDLLAKYGYGTKVDITSKDQLFPAPIMGGMSLDKYVKDVEKMDNTPRRLND